MANFSRWFLRTDVPTGGGGGGGRGALPPYNCLCLPISVYSEYVFGASRNDKITGNNEEGIITFKDNPLLKFSRFFAKLLANNCCS